MKKASDFQLRKFVIPEIVYGMGSRHMVGAYAKNFGARRVLVVTDPGVMTAGWTAEVVASLEAAMLSYRVFSQVTPNPRDCEVMQGAALYEAEGCDVIVAVGGGSPIDCAKGIGIVISNRQNIVEFAGIDKIHKPMPPLICIPTTSGSSADISQFAIINYEAERTKIAIISKAVIPDVALIDPQTLTTMPPYLTACTALDALVHGIEAFVSNAHSSLTDLHALQAIRLIAGNLDKVLADGKDLAGWERLMQGSMEAGIAFSNASLGAVHSMAHSLGGYLDLPHGQCNVTLLAHVLAFNYDSAPERYDQVALAMGLDLGGMLPAQRRAALLAALRDITARSGTLKSLGEMGVSSADISTLARKAVRDPCLITNPRQVSQGDLEVIYGQAL